MADNIKQDDVSAPADVAAEPVVSSGSEAASIGEHSAAADAPGDDLESLLDEFDRLSGNQSASEEQPGAGEGDVDSMIDALMASTEREAQWVTERQQFDQRLAQGGVDLALRDGQIRELRGVVENLQRQAEETRWREHVTRSLQDFRTLVAEEQQKLSDLDVEPDFAETWLLAAQARDPQLRDAWESRYYQPPDPLQRAALERGIIERGNLLARAALQIQDPTQRALAEKNIRQEMERLYAATFPDPAKLRQGAELYVRRTLAQMRKAASRPRLDPALSEDRLAVVAAVRSAGGGKVHSEPPPQFGRLSTRELNRYTEQTFGFTAV